MRSHGTFPVDSPGEVAAFSETRKLPQVCPNLPAIVARKIEIYDPADDFINVDASNSQRVIAGIGIDPFTNAYRRTRALLPTLPDLRASHYRSSIPITTALGHCKARAPRRSTTEPTIPRINRCGLASMQRGACIEAHGSIARSCGEQQFSLGEALRTRMRVSDSEPVTRASRAWPFANGRAETRHSRRPFVHFGVADARVERDGAPMSVDSKHAIEIRCSGSIPMEMKTDDPECVSRVAPSRSSRGHVSQVAFGSAPMMQRFVRASPVITRGNIVRSQRNDAIEGTQSGTKPSRSIRAETIADRDSQCERIVSMRIDRSRRQNHRRCDVRTNDRRIATVRTRSNEEASAGERRRTCRE